MRRLLRAMDTCASKREDPFESRADNHADRELRGQKDVPVLNAQLVSIATKLLKIAGALVALYAVVTVALFAIMLQSPDKFAGTMRYVPWPAFVVLPFKPLWNVARRGQLAVGDMAPDFSLQSPDHTSTFQLSSMRGHRPVVLVFGSYT
jgi:hypothetical protein